MKKMLIAAAIAMAATTASFGAVKANKIGANFQYDGSLPTFGVWWHVTDMVAIAPSIGFKNTSNTYNSTAANKEDSTTELQLGVGVPIYLAHFNALSLFVAPEFSYTSKSDKLTPQAGASTTSSSSVLGISAALGLQVEVHAQVHLFGAFAFGYSSEDTGNASGQKTGIISTTRTAIGAIFYFN